MSRPLLVLRPEPGAARTAERAAAMGLEVIGVPLFEVAPRPWDAPGPEAFDAILFTSANALRHGGAGLSRYASLPAYAVGRTTAEAARAAGFADVRTGPGDLAGLVPLIAADGRRDILHLCGVDHRAVAGFTPTAVPVYEAREIPDPALAEALSRQPVILAHSPRKAARLAALVTDRHALSAVAISPAAAAALGEGWARVEVAETPDDDAMLAIAARLCD